MTLNQNLYGVWKMTQVRFLDNDGKWEIEPGSRGTFVFTESGHLNTYTSTVDLAFGYTGNFVVKGDEMFIKVDICTIGDLEGKTIIRTVKKLTPDHLTLGFHDDATGRTYEIEFVILTRTFVTT